METIIVENFFSNFENIKNEFKKIPLYSLSEYNEKFNKNTKDNWPGKRSQLIHETNPFLFNLINKELVTKVGMFSNIPLTMKCSVNLRLKEDDEKDWIHVDPNYYTLLVYLSETNLNSGTAIYPEKKDIPSTVVGFVQNRALLFRSYQRHRSIKNYGDNLENGRITLTCFIDVR